MKVIIVESPNKCKTISKYVGDEYKLMASKGHIRKLATKGQGGLGIKIDEGFVPVYVDDPKKKIEIKELKEAAKKADEVILATDDDREGEAISWHLAQVLGLPVETTKRIRFSEITKPAVLSSLENPSVINMDLVDAQQCRRMSDRVIGFKLSTLLQKNIRSQSAGRVQSATLKLICVNDQEIKDFVPQEYWVIELEIEVDGKTVTLALDKVDGEKISAKNVIPNEEKAVEIFNRISDTLDLTNLEKKLKKKAAPFPFTTSTLQQEAYNRYHYSTTTTMSIAQKLFQGVELDGEATGLISYHRTDSTRISPNFYETKMKPYILDKFGEKYLGPLRAAKNKAGAQDGHEAIRAVHLDFTPEFVSKFLSDEETKIYRLIYNRTLASVMTPKETEVTVAEFETNGLTFRAQGSRIVFDGYERADKEMGEEDANLLPELVLNQKYEVKNKTKEQKFTNPPARFSEARTVKEMEAQGIGRPSTYASTIRTLIDRNYVTSKSGVLTPTEQGIKTVVVLEKYFPEIVSAEYSSHMESRLDEVEAGEVSREEAMKEFYYPFMEQFEEVSKVMYKDPLEETGEMCPECGAPLVIRHGRFGDFVACSAYPECTYKKVEEKKAPVETGKLCPDCGSPLVYRFDKKTGEKSFVGCSNFPACHHTENLDGTPTETKKKTKKVYTEEDYVKPCPDCNGHLVIRNSRKGQFLGCINFPRCRHIEELPATEESKKEEN